MKKILGPVRICGRSWEVLLGERSADRRAMAWCGVGPVRSWADSSGPLVYDTGANEPTPPLSPVMGVSVHAGRWLLLVLPAPTPQPRVPGVLATLRDIERMPNDGL